ncbi:hypothetical protein A9308_00710 [Moraxella atlantae]|uniref:IrrE N-terminal-like domain-containing protein n=1 Tax=Faucicola atlantae TaxID=34059 RepID=A0A1B8Q909_9GAMM|nr:ImmA/IrrE family metallo-endopeptidase [Moraxella atlantae]OBX73763.1 hypothetical protein A9308_00710 [Moraxella atlantae]
MHLDFQHHTKGVRVSPRSKKSICGLARALRQKVAQAKDDQALDLCKLIELVLPKATNNKFEFVIKNYGYMGNTEAAMSPDSMKMYIREDVYEALHADDPRARFTIAHEIGHFILHDGVALGRDNGSPHKIFEDSEWQANVFAAELLAPLDCCVGLDVEDVMEIFCVSRSCAQYRKKETQELMP